MIRLLYLAPAIAVVGGILIVYMIFVRPVLKNEKGQGVTASAAIEDIRNDLGKVKRQQDILAGAMEEQRKDLLKQSANAIKLYDQANRDDYKDMDLVRLKGSISVFNQQALELAGNENAVISFNDQLREGIAALDRQVKEMDFADLLSPKENLAARLNSMKIQVARLVGLQKEIILKSKEYNDRSSQAIAALKTTLKEQAVNIAALKSDRTVVLEQTIQDTISRQDDMLARVSEQGVNLVTIRQQNYEQMLSSQERIKSILEESRSRMEASQDRAGYNDELLSSAKDRMDNAKDRAQDAKDRQRAMLESLRDRRN